MTEERSVRTVEDNRTEILNGSIVSISLKIGFPVFVGHILLLFYSVVDTVFISMLDKSSTAIMSGIGLVFPIAILYYALALGLYTGISSLVARAIGEENHSILDRIADSGLFLCTSISILMIVMAYGYGKELIQLLAGSELSIEDQEFGVAYLFYITPGFVVLLLNMLFLGILQGEGQSLYYALAMLISTVLNIILDPIFIFGLNMGVAGAALATTISFSLSFVVILIIYMKRKTEIPLHWNFLIAKVSIMKEILRIGIPEMASMAALSIAGMFLNNIISSINETVMNAWVIVTRFDSFNHVVGYSLGAACLTLVGQNYGNQNTVRVKKIFNKNIMMGLIGGLIFTGLYILAAPFLFPLFSSIEEVVAGAVLQVRVLSLTQIGVVVSVIVTCCFQGTGRALPGLILTLIQMGFIAIPLSYYLVMYTQLGIYGVFIGIASANLCILVVSLCWGNLYLNHLKFNRINAL